MGFFKILLKLMFFFVFFFWGGGWLVFAVVFEQHSFETKDTFAW